MVKQFKRRHTSNLVGAEMHDDGFPNNSNSDEDYQYEKKEETFNNDEDEYPNLDNPSISKDFTKDRSLKLNNKMSDDIDEDSYNVGCENEPKINPPNITMDRKASSNSTSNGDYEVIGEQIPRNSAIKKSKFSEEDKENRKLPIKKSLTTKVPTYSKTDKGFSELSNCKKENLSAKVCNAAV